MKGLKTFLNESRGDLLYTRNCMRELILKVFTKYKTNRVGFDELMQAICNIGWTYDNKKSSDTQLIFYIDTTLNIRLNVNIIIKKFGNEVEMVDYKWES